MSRPASNCLLPVVDSGRPNLQEDAMPPSLATPRSTEEGRRDFRRLLKLVDDDLETRDLKAIMFLCSDMVPGARLEKMTRAIELFEELEKNVGTADAQMNGYLQLVAECLQAADRLDLLRHLGYTRQSLAAAVLTGGRRLSTFRLMLHHIAQEVTKDEVAALRFLLRGHGVSRKKLDEAVDMYDLFSVALQPGLIRDSDVTLLVMFMVEIGRGDLADVARQYQDSSGVVNSSQTMMRRQFEMADPSAVQSEPGTHANWAAGEQAALCSSHSMEEKNRMEPVCDSAQPLLKDNPGLSANRGGSDSSLSTGPQQQQQPQQLHVVPVPQPGQSTADLRRKVQMSEEADLPSYPMERNPRGICVLINNVNFRYVPTDPESKPGIKNRPGSDTDCLLLEEVFPKLGFNVRKHVDLASQDLVRLLQDYANMDHTRYDAFACCLLSHGVEGCVYGSDSRLVPIKDLTQPFVARNCRTLSGKPKLFFIQACQGKMKQLGAAPALEMDADEREISLIPDEADFLLGFATVPGYVSFRSPQHGSWYIRKLAEMLQTYGGRYDLLSILTRVNDEVSKGDARIQDELGPMRYKQMPAPITTLRKRLYFKPLPSDR